MRAPRNPFRLRSSERIESDGMFLELFGPGVLDLLPDDLWDQRLIIRSSAGGGKSTLLRLLTPSVLRMVHALGVRNEATSLTFKWLRGRGILDARGPTVAGTLLSLGGKYAPLVALDQVDAERRDRLFLALLNARIVLAALRAHLELADLTFPDDLSRLTIDPPTSGTAVTRPQLPADGRQLFEWARDLETHVAKALGSLRPPDAAVLPGDDELTALEILRPGAVLVDGTPSPARTVVLLDDVHRLAPRQRRLLIDMLLARRAPTPVWLAERSEALAPDQVLSLGAKTDRDFNVVDIEQHWRGVRASTFHKVALSVADRRTALSPDVAITSFAAALTGPDDGSYASVLPGLEARLQSAARDRNEFRTWVETRIERGGTARERAVSLRVLEIQIAREMAANQLTFDLVVRDEESLAKLDERRDAARLREAAERFVTREFGLPFYFGADRLSQLASSNIERFLGFAGDLFEDVASSTVRRRTAHVGPARQEQLIERATKAMWDELPGSVEGGTAVQNVLDGVGEFCAEHTFRPTAPYVPGVTGIALRRSDSVMLQEAVEDKRGTWEATVGRLLANMLVHNLVQAQPSEAKGQRWVVYYLNRALCVRYQLPLGYGGWQPVTPDQLLGWSSSDRVRGHSQAVLS